jgi:peroxiredoxin
MSLRLLATLLALGLFARASAAADIPPNRLGEKIAPFELKDVSGKTVSLEDYRAKKAVVVVFVGTECPINNAYMPRLAQLAKEFGPKGVQFLAVNANRQDSVERVAAHAKKHELPFPVLKDGGNRVADSFGARRTPEAFLLDAQGTVRYQGRIDDQFGVGYNRPKPTRRDLAVAVEELLAGKAVSRPNIPAAGCLIARVSTAKESGDVTFAKHIAPILQKNCQECHRPGQVGPMALFNYEDAAAWAETIREVIEENRMPPWYADPRYGKFANDRRLTAAERDTLLKWVAQGTPKGDDTDLPPPRAFAEGWVIGQPDLVLTMPKEFSVPAEAPKRGIPYQRFFVDTDFKEDRWVERAEARPGSPAVVHHIIVYVSPPGKEFKTGRREMPVLCGTAPGDMPLILPPGTAKQIPAGSRLMFEMHYTPNGVAQTDRSSVGLVLAKKPPERPVYTVPVLNPRFKIPPGADNHQVESEYLFEEDGRLLGFMPHMHLRGKDFRYEVIYPDGKKETLLSVPRYNFNWQSVYRLAEPKRMPKGTKLHCLAHFDNSAKNPNNPDPTLMVRWGEQTWEEMMIGWIDFAAEPKKQEK